MRIRAKAQLVVSVKFPKTIGCNTYWHALRLLSRHRRHRKLQHFIAIADAWEAAGLSLAGELTEQPARIEDFVVAFGGGASILIISVIFAVWRRNGQENE